MVRSLKLGHYFLNENSLESIFYIKVCKIVQILCIDCRMFTDISILFAKLAQIKSAVKFEFTQILIPSIHELVLLPAISAGARGTFRTLSNTTFELFCENTKRFLAITPSQKFDKILNMSEYTANKKCSILIKIEHFECSA